MSSPALRPVFRPLSASNRQVSHDSDRTEASRDGHLSPVLLRRDSSNSSFTGRHERAVSSGGFGYVDDLQIVASNMPDILLMHQAALQYLPPVPPLDHTTLPVCGFLHLQRNSMKWAKVWCQYKDGILTYRDGTVEDAEEFKLRVAHCQSEIPPSSNAIATHFTTQPDNSSYWKYLTDNEEEGYAFMVHTPSRVFVFRAEDEKTRNKFVDVLREDLLRHLGEELFAEKDASIQVIGPYLREQYITEIKKYDTLLGHISRHAFVEDSLPITSIRKDKSGVLAMLTDLSDGTSWKDFYFVLFENALYFYKDSKSTSPTGFVTLDAASLHLHVKKLGQGECVFRINTPLNTLMCRTKHPVALSEWVTVLESVITHVAVNDIKDEKWKLERRNSLEILENINNLLSNVSSLDLLVLNPSGYESFLDFCREKEEDCKEDGLVNELEFFREIEHFRWVVGIYIYVCERGYVCVWVFVSIPLLSFWPIVSHFPSPSLSLHFAVLPQIIHRRTRVPFECCRRDL